MKRERGGGMSRVYKEIILFESETLANEGVNHLFLQADSRKARTEDRASGGR